MVTWVDLGQFYDKVRFGNLGFPIGKSENSGFSETIAACDLKVGREGNGSDVVVNGRI